MSQIGNLASNENCVNTLGRVAGSGWCMSNTYLLAKALAYAIVAIELRPETIWEQSDYDDMVALFRKLPASEREMFLDEARRDLTGVRKAVSV